MKAKTDSSVLGTEIENNSDYEVPDSLVLKIASVRQELIDLKLPITVTVTVRDIDIDGEVL